MNQEYKNLLTKKIDRLKEKNSLLKWEVKNLRGFLKYKGYTEEQIRKVSLSYDVDERMCFLRGEK
tara:strand:- start:75 stop:269 length:195 start_codon:yes stop_codon:yes gene_type:complete